MAESARKGRVGHHKTERLDTRFLKEALSKNRGAQEEASLEKNLSRIDYVRQAKTHGSSASWLGHAENLKKTTTHTKPRR